MVSSPFFEIAHSIHPGSAVDGTAAPGLIYAMSMYPSLGQEEGINGQTLFGP